VESRFFEPPKETKIGSKNRIVGEFGAEILVFDRGEGRTFGWSHREVLENEGLRNRNSTVS